MGDAEVEGAGPSTSSPRRSTCEDRVSTPVLLPARKSEQSVPSIEQDKNPISAPVTRSDVFDREAETVEEESLIPKEESRLGLSQREILIWNERARTVALISAVYSITVFATSMAGAIAIDSASLLSLALEALTDFFGDCLVFWRFSGNMDERTATIYDQQASVLISFVMLTSCMIVTAGAIRKLAHSKHPHTTPWVLYIHGVIFLISTILTSFKVWIAYAIKSHALMLDAVTGGVVAFLSGIYILNAYLAHKLPDTWFLDSSIAIVASAFIIFMGTHTLCKNDFTNKSFWEQPSWAPRGGFDTGTPKESLRRRSSFDNDSTPA